MPTLHEEYPMQSTKLRQMKNVAIVGIYDQDTDEESDNSEILLAAVRNPS